MKPNHASEARSDLRSQVAAARQRESIWEPPAQSAASVAALPATIAIEGQIAELLARPVDASEGHRIGNDRKERELLALLDTLTPVEALSLSRRLAVARRDDALVAAFAERLSPERRARVTAYVADTRRRIALRQAR